MKVGDLVRLVQESPGYHTHFYDEVMLVTEIIEELDLSDPHGHFIQTDPVAGCVSESGQHRFPVEDLEVVFAE